MGTPGILPESPGPVLILLRPAPHLMLAYLREPRTNREGVPSRYPGYPGGRCCLLLTNGDESPENRAHVHRLHFPGWPRDSVGRQAEQTFPL